MPMGSVFLENPDLIQFRRGILRLYFLGDGYPNHTITLFLELWAIILKHTAKASSYLFIIYQN